MGLSILLAGNAGMHAAVRRDPPKGGGGSVQELWRNMVTGVAGETRQAVDVIAEGVRKRKLVTVRPLSTTRMPTHSWPGRRPRGGLKFVLEPGDVLGSNPT